MLVGRRDELRQIGGLLAAVKRGRSGALVLVGEPGIGKSVLLEEAVAQPSPSQVVCCARLYNDPRGTRC